MKLNSSWIGCQAASCCHPGAAYMHHKTLKPHTHAENGNARIAKHVITNTKSNGNITEYVMCTLSFSAYLDLLAFLLFILLPLARINSILPPALIYISFYRSCCCCCCSVARMDVDDPHSTHLLNFRRPTKKGFIIFGRPYSNSLWSQP